MLNFDKTSENIREISQLFNTFLGLVKSNGYSLEKIHEIVLIGRNPRELAFFKIFKPIYIAYEEYLGKQNQIDFDDMLIKLSLSVS